MSVCLDVFFVFNSISIFFRLITTPGQLRSVSVCARTSVCHLMYLSLLFISLLSLYSFYFAYS